MDTDNLTSGELLSFALWLFSRQTVIEKEKKQTIERNDIGFNNPDALALSPMLDAIQSGTPFDQAIIFRFVENFVRPRICKYKKQYKIFVNEKHSKTTNCGGTVGNCNKQKQGELGFVD